NLAQADEHVRAAAADGARLVVLPEKWNVLGSPSHLRAGAEPLDGPAVTWMCSTAAELGVDLVGSVCVSEAGEDKLRNVCVPAGFTLATTRDHWEILVRARAIEDQAFVVAANQIGEHGGGLRSGGRSLIVDPWGLVLATAPDRVGHVVAELDLGAQERVRRE